MCGQPKELQTSGLCFPFFQERGQQLWHVIVDVFGWQVNTLAQCVGNGGRRETFIFWPLESFFLPTHTPLEGELR